MGGKSKVKIFNALVDDEQIVVDRPVSINHRFTGFDRFNCMFGPV
ncbi:hypothetical protein A2U01_0106578, partial [Trifolium medium]|nr:hypothetical protein [Trifolium medium]